MSSTTSPNMSLVIPTVGQEPGPTFAFDINASLTILDSHTHDPGSGIPITPSGLNINSALTFQNNLATNLAGANFFAQLSAPTSIGTVYVKLGTEGTPRPDLWYYDGFTQVQITAGGNVNATAANIPGESYAGGTFTWVQGTGSTTPANFAIGSITISPATPGGGTLGPTLGPNAAVTTAYALQLPLPNTLGSTAFMTLDASGNMNGGSISTSGGITGSMIGSATITGGNIAAATILGSNIAGSTITGSNIANGTIVASNIANHTVGPLQSSVNYVASGNNNATATSSTFILAGAVTITTNGNPVDIAFCPVLGSIGTNSGFVLNGSAPFCEVLITMNAGGIASQVFGSNFTGIFAYAPGIVNFTDLSAVGVSGSRAYQLLFRFSSGSGTITVANCVLVASEKS